MAFDSQPRSIPCAFDEQVRLNPAAPALLWGEQVISYAELNERVDCLAAVLRERGVMRGSRVGLGLERSPELVISMLAVLKAGGAYVPVDPGWPSDRIRMLLGNADVRVAIAPAAGEKEWREGFDCVSPLAEDLNFYTDDSSPPDAACVMYTSGSTGAPKGALILHKGILRLVKGADYVRFDRNEVFLQMAPASFDASTFEIWGALLNGAALAILQPQTPSLPEIGQALRRYRVSTLWLTAGLFHLMVEQQLEDFGSVRQLVAGGDVLSPAHVRRFLERWPECTVVNGYGPTETTTFACCHRIRPEDLTGGAIPVGRPIHRTIVRILDGEIYIGGDGVAAGYVNQPELTRERFIVDPLDPAGEARLYRTGDAGRMREDGCVEFHGRLDEQFKINGFRVEPAEIEEALVGHAGVRQAAVTVQADSTGRKRMVAYIVVRQGVENSELRNFLSAKLPPYMVPSEFFAVGALPLTPNGKVDRKALSPAAAETKGSKTEGILDPLEQEIAAAWRKALGTESLSPDRNFFELGGDSLRLLVVHAELEKIWKREIAITSLLEFPTIRSLGEWARRGRTVSGLSDMRERAGRQRASLPVRRPAGSSPLGKSLVKPS